MQFILHFLMCRRFIHCIYFSSVIKQISYKVHVRMTWWWQKVRWDHPCQDLWCMLCVIHNDSINYIHQIITIIISLQSLLIGSVPSPLSTFCGHIFTHTSSLSHDLFCLISSKNWLSLRSIFLAANLASFHASEYVNICLFISRCATEPRCFPTWWDIQTCYVMFQPSPHQIFHFVIQKRDKWSSIFHAQNMILCSSTSFFPGSAFCIPSIIVPFFHPWKALEKKWFQRVVHTHLLFNITMLCSFLKYPPKHSVSLQKKYSCR